MGQKSVRDSAMGMGIAAPMSYARQGLRFDSEVGAGSAKITCPDPRAPSSSASPGRVFTTCFCLSIGLHLHVLGHIIGLVTSGLSFSRPPASWPTASSLQLSPSAACRWCSAFLSILLVESDCHCASC